MTAQSNDHRIFRREHHNNILECLRNLNGVMLLKAECYFGGGTAIVLGLDEYRESVDIDFICSSQDGYRMLRHEVFDSPGLGKILKSAPSVKMLRDVRSDQYGVRTVLGVGDTKIKFEIIRESRIELDGRFDKNLRVPVLTHESMYAEKLLANADRWADKAVLNRDMIDLTMMISRWGPIPQRSWEIAENAYGPSVRVFYEKAVERIRNPEWLKECMLGMAMEPDLEDEILFVHGGAIEPTGSKLSGS